MFRRLFSVLLLIIYAISQTHATTHHPTLATYASSLIQHLAAQRTGTFDCWFYHAGGNSSAPHSDILEGIYSALPSESVRRMVLNSHFEWPPMEENKFDGKLPELLVIHFEYSRKDMLLWSHFGRMLAVVPCHIKVVVLLDMGKTIGFRSLAPLFYMAKILDVVYLSTSGKGTMYFDVYRRKTVRRSRYLAVEEVFVDLARDLNGYGISFGTVERSMSNMCFERGFCLGYDVSLVAEMAEFLNGTLIHLYNYACPDYMKNAELFDCVRETAFQLGCEFDIFIEPAISGQYSSFYLDTPVPVDDTFLVPIGRPLNVVEFFWMPFQYELWTVLFFGMILLKIVSLLMPHRFRNDILLLPICGFERFNLNHAVRSEKFVLLSLIVLFFFVSNAYEAKIVSLMSERPRIRTVESIQDFLQFDMKIKAARGRARYQLPQLEPLFIYRNDSDPSEDKLDGVNAYLTNSLMAHILMRRSFNWDFDLNRPRYKQLDETLGMMVAFYPLPRRSNLRLKFRFVQRALFEAGILKLWRDHSVRDMSGGWLQPGVVQGFVNAMAEILNFSDLLPAWFVVLVGCAIGLTVFVVELLLKNMNLVRRAYRYQ